MQCETAGEFCIFFSLSSELSSRRYRYRRCWGYTKALLTLFSLVYRSHFPSLIRENSAEGKRNEEGVKLLSGNLPLNESHRTQLNRVSPRETILCTCYDWLLSCCIHRWGQREREKKNTCIYVCTYIHMPPRAHAYVHIYLYIYILSYCYDCFVTIVICHLAACYTDGLRSADYTSPEPCVHIES